QLQGFRHARRLRARLPRQPRMYPCARRRRTEAFQRSAERNTGNDFELAALSINPNGSSPACRQREQLLGDDRRDATQARSFEVTREKAAAPPIASASPFGERRQHYQSVTFDEARAFDVARNA